MTPPAALDALAQAAYEAHSPAVPWKAVSEALRAFWRTIAMALIGRICPACSGWGRLVVSDMGGPWQIVPCQPCDGTGLSDGELPPLESPESLAARLNGIRARRKAKGER